jgi:MFS family permease
MVRSIGARLPDRLGAHRAVRLALAGIAAGLVIIGGWQSISGLVAGTVVLGLGVALATPAIFVLALDGVPQNERGAVLGAVSMSIDVAFGLGPVVFGLVAAGAGRDAGFLVAAGVAGAGLLLAARRGQPAVDSRI